MIDVSNRVLTNIKFDLKDLCTNVTSNNSDSPATLPTASVVQIDNPERAMDMENGENAVNSVIEIQVFSNVSLSESKNIVNACCDAMRKMGYIRTYGPTKISNASDTNIYRMVARFSRIVNSVYDIPKFK